uniref:Uncharacterized protein n=1 Tax=Arundo donax TaxID=35708 RepID=A0A0A9FTU2_ARUDO
MRSTKHTQYAPRNPGFLFLAPLPVVLLLPKISRLKFDHSYVINLNGFLREKDNFLLYTTWLYKTMPHGPFVP